MKTIKAERFYYQNRNWYKGKDIINALGYSPNNVTNIITKKVPENHRTLYHDGSNNFWVVSSYGLSLLILQSKSDYSNQLIDLLCKEYIPSLVI